MQPKIRAFVALRGSLGHDGQDGDLGGRLDPALAEFVEDDGLQTIAGRFVGDADVEIEAGAQMVSVEVLLHRVTGGEEQRTPGARGL